MSRLFCGACGTLVPAGSSFCPSCGQPVASQGTKPELRDHLFDQMRATPVAPQHQVAPVALPDTSDSAFGPRIPGVGITVLVTLFLGLFGLIPATIHTNRAASMGAPTTRYWKAFGWTMATGALIAVALSAALFLGALGVLSGSNPDQYASSPEVLPEVPADDSQLPAEPSEVSPSEPPDTGAEEETANAPVVLPNAAQVCAESSGVGPYSVAAVGNAKTSCPFAEAVRSAYDSSGAGGTDVLVDAFSPVTEKWYTVQCGGDGPVTCTGTPGLDILIFIYSSDAEVLRSS